MVRRFLVVLAAVVVGMSVLVVAGSPVGAANTASEGGLDAKGVREFAGANRYATSVVLAEAYAEARGFIDSVILASGESAVDAAAAAGLAASKGAPVLLTTPNRLSRAVEDFLVEQFVAEVFIIGGLEVVSQRVEDDLLALDTVDVVTRLAGPDRYATSAAIADEMGSFGEYCDTNQISAVVVNVDESASDVIAVGPLAYAMELPVLLTRADELPSEVAGFLTDAEIERVIVVGGSDAVSAVVIDEILAAGVSDVTVITGENRYATALAIRAALAGCDAEFTLSATNYAVINGEATADGVSAAPLLGIGAIAGSEGPVTPVLLVATDGVPAETLAYLEALPTRNSSGGFTDASFTAIGGTAVVPDSVMDAVVAAAISSEPITATISATAGSSTATIAFSTGVQAGDPSSKIFRGDTVMISDNSPTVTIRENEADQGRQHPEDGVHANGCRDGDRLEGAGELEGAAETCVPDPDLETRLPITTFSIGTRPADVRSGDATNKAYYAINGQALVSADMVTISGRTVTITLDGGDRFAAGDVITVAGGKIASIGGDNRKAQSASYTVPALVPDVLRPRVTVFAPENGHELLVQVTETSLKTTSFAPASVSHNSKALPTVATVISGTKSFTVCLFGDGTGVNAGTCKTTAGTGEAVLAKGDLITIKAEAFTDNSGNTSRTTIARVAANNDKPEVTRATVTAPAVYDSNGALPGGEQNASWKWGAGGDADFLTITAKTDSNAAGALGNAWSVEWVEVPSSPATNRAPEVSVDVYGNRKIIRIIFDNDAKLFHVVAALLENDAVSANFAVTSDVLADPTNAAVNKDLAGILTGTYVPDPNGEFGFPLTTINNPGPTRTNIDDFETTSTSRDLTGGVSTVTVTLTYNDILRSFDYASATGLRGANEYGFATRWTLAARTKLVTQISFGLRSSILTDLPKTGGSIDLPANVATSYKTAATDAFVTSGAASTVRLRAG